MSITLKEALYQKYIAPTERPAGRFVGVELEYPLVNLSRRPVDIPAVQEVVRGFAERFQFTEQRKDDNGNLYSLTGPVTGTISPSIAASIHWNFLSARRRV